MVGTPTPAHPPLVVAEAKQLVETVGHGSAGWLEATQYLEAHAGIESKLTSPSTVTAAAAEDVTEACRAERGLSAGIARVGTPRGSSMFSMFSTSMVVAVFMAVIVVVSVWIAASPNSYEEYNQVHVSCRKRPGPSPL